MTSKPLNLFRFGWNLSREGHFYAVRAIEVLGLAERGGVVRTGICMYNLREEVDRLLEAIAAIAK